MKSQDSVMAASFNNSNRTRSHESSVFEVCRMSDLSIDEENVLQTPNNLAENNNHLKYNLRDSSISNGYISDEKSEKRDSGFHTMTRHKNESSSNETVPVSNMSATASKPPIIKITDVNSKKQAPIRRKRSSPLIRRKDTVKRNQEAMEAKASQLAKELFNLQGKKKRDVSQHLCQQDDFGILVAKKYMEFFSFSCVALDESLRLLLQKFALLGESQERERILRHFAERYKHCNPHFLDGDVDSIHTLICATALLNTDLHGPRVGGRRRMSSKQFINNLAGLSSQGNDFPPNLLKEIYRSIKKKPLPWCETEPTKKSAAVRKNPSVLIANTKQKSNQSNVVIRSQSMNQQSIHKVRTVQPFQEDAGGRKIGAGRSSKSKTLPRKQGVLWRKSVFDSDGNKTAKRKRRWKLVVGALHGLELHLAKRDTSDSTKISLHHCLAEVDASNQSTKRTNVFRLTLANKSVTLYQASSKEEQKTWVRSINRNSALLSAAPLSAGIGSQVKFQKPLMPSASSTLPLNKQLSSQQDRLERLGNELDEHESNCPRDGAPASEKQYYKDKLDYLQHEVHKYEVYTNSLSELVRSTRSQQTLSLSKSEDGFTEPQFAPDTGSLLSVSPSEPGTVPFNNLSGFPQNNESSGSIGDLLEMDPKKRPTHLMVGASPLSPTSSLPNLHPSTMHRFPDTPQKFQQQSPSYRSSDSYELVPSVSETESGSSSVRLIRQDVSPSSSSPHPANQNNSNNNIFNFDSIPFPQSSSVTDDLNTGKSSPIAVAVNTPPVESDFCTSTPVGRVIVHPHHANGSLYNPSTLFVTTSYLSNHRPLWENKTLMRGGPKTGGAQNGGLHQNFPPRVRGRKERKGTARHSYLQAVSEPTHS